MQEASGTEFTNCNWCAQPSSADLAANFDSHSFPLISFSPLVRPMTHCTDMPGGMPVVLRSLMSVRLRKSRAVPGLVQQAGISRLALSGVKQAVRAAAAVKI